MSRSIFFCLTLFLFPPPPSTPIFFINILMAFGFFGRTKFRPMQKLIFFSVFGRSTLLIIIIWYKRKNSIHIHMREWMISRVHTSIISISLLAVWHPKFLLTTDGALSEISLRWWGGGQVFCMLNDNFSYKKENI